MNKGYVRVMNLTRRTLLARKARIASAPLERLVGLIGRENLPAGEGLILRPCKAIHTFFMRFPIDAIFLDSRFRILQLKENMQPFRISPFLSGAYCVLEVPAGTVRETATEKGDMLSVAPAE